MLARCPPSVDLTALNSHPPAPLPAPAPRPQDCLRALLAVLMNLTQNNPGGCAAVVGAGALEPLAGLLAQMVRGGPKIKGEWWP